MKLFFYLLKRFFFVFLGAVGFFSMVLLLIDLLMNLWNYISNAAPPAQVFRVMILYLPKAVWYSVPLAVLFASSYVLSVFYSNNELIAIFASGVSLFKFTFPLLFVSALMTLGLFLFEDKVVVNTYAQKQALQNDLLNFSKTKNNDRIVILGEGGNLVYRSEYYDDSTQQIFNSYFVFRDENKNLEAVIYAPLAEWNESNWKLQSAMQYKFDNDGELLISAPEEKYFSRLTEPAETFRNNTISVEEVSTKEAREYIERLERTGMSFQEELSVYYKKFAFPFVVFIAVFMSIGLSGKTRKNVMLMSLALSITATVLFYGLQMLTMLLAKFGYISAFNGAWFPVILFIILSVVLLRFART